MGSCGGVRAVGCSTRAAVGSRSRCWWADRRRFDHRRSPHESGKSQAAVAECHVTSLKATGAGWSLGDCQAIFRSTAGAFRYQCVRSPGWAVSIWARNFEELPRSGRGLLPLPSIVESDEPGLRTNGPMTGVGRVDHLDISSFLGAEFRWWPTWGRLQPLRESAGHSDAEHVEAAHGVGPAIRLAYDLFHV